MSISKDRWQKREAFSALVEKGDYQGYITTDDIIAVFPEAEELEERMERLQAFFRRTPRSRKHSTWRLLPATTPSGCISRKWPEFLF